MALLMSPLARTQYAALTRMRLQMLVNSLRSKRASFDLAARIIRITFWLWAWSSAPGWAFRHFR